MTVARTILFGVGCLAMVGCFGGCDEENSYSSPPPDLNIDGYWPCIVAPGSNITVFGTNLDRTTLAEVGGQRATIVSKSAGRIVLKTSLATLSGQISLRDGGVEIARRYQDPPTIGSEVIVPEIEPNDDINGANATPMGKNREASGTLATPLDADHFVRDCFHPTSVYQITVNPPGIPVVYVDGVAVTLTAGRGSFTATRDKVLFGLTGGIGTYKITVDLLNF